MNCEMNKMNNTFAAFYFCKKMQMYRIPTSFDSNKPEVKLKIHSLK